MRQPVHYLFIYLSNLVFEFYYSPPGTSERSWIATNSSIIFEECRTKCSARSKSDSQSMMFVDIYRQKLWIQFLMPRVWNEPLLSRTIRIHFSEYASHESTTPICIKSRGSPFYRALFAYHRKLLALSLSLSRPSGDW